MHTHHRDSITVADAAELWIKAAEAEKLERSTIKRYRELADIYVKPKFGGRKLSSLSHPMVQEFRLELLQSKSRAMVHKIIRALSAILNNAVTLGAINQNVAAAVRVGKVKREAKKIVIPTRAELKAMIGAAGVDCKPLMLTAITTGLRSSATKEAKVSPGFLLGNGDPQPVLSERRGADGFHARSI